MSKSRPDLPAELKRSVLVEAGHRCAIPTCRQVPVEVAHIVPWVKVKEHVFDNLIALCPTCHTRYDRGEIDRKSMLQYKANLEILNHRYTDVERQLLKAFLRRWHRARRIFPSVCLTETGRIAGIGQIRIHPEMTWLISNLIDDELIELQEPDREILLRQEAFLSARVVRLTQKGLAFVAQWAKPGQLE